LRISTDIFDFKKVTDVLQAAQQDPKSFREGKQKGVIEQLMIEQNLYNAWTEEGRLASDTDYTHPLLPRGGLVITTK
jgi:hypothetical protein